MAAFVGLAEGSRQARDAMKKEALRRAGIGYEEVVSGEPYSCRAAAGGEEAGAARGIALTNFRKFGWSEECL